jgi:DNA repair protein RadC
MKKNGSDITPGNSLPSQATKMKKKATFKRPKKFNEVPLFDRPREKMIKKGPKALSNLELIAAVLGLGSSGRDVYELAWEIVKLAEKNFNNLSIDKLKSIEGIGTAKACQVMAAIEFSRRFLLHPPIVIGTDKDVIPLIAEIADRKQEFFLTLTIDGANHLIEKRTVAIGTVNQSLVHPREIFADAVSDRAAGIILVHNHPSGDHSPSVEDYKVTDRMAAAGNLMGISVVDHIIISRNGYYSFQKNGYIRKV